jgi:hypothetical protein
MNPSLLGVLAAFALATGLWLAGRRPRPLLKSTDTREVAALNRAQNTLVWEARQAPPAEASANPANAAGGPGGGLRVGEAVDDGWAPAQPLAPVPSPRLSAAERQAWLRELRRHERAGGPMRLAALRRARAWGSRDTLPLLRRGLRDTDPAVVREAALAMEAFRGRPSASWPSSASRPSSVSGPLVRPRPVQAKAAPRTVARTL